MGRTSTGGLKATERWRSVAPRSTAASAGSADTRPRMAFTAPSAPTRSCQGPLTRASAERSLTGQGHDPDKPLPEARDRATGGAHCTNDIPPPGSALPVAVSFRAVRRYQIGFTLHGVEHGRRSTRRWLGWACPWPSESKRILIARETRQWSRNPATPRPALPPRPCSRSQSGGPVLSRQCGPSPD